MKNLSRGRATALGLALIASGLAAPPALAAATAAAAPDPDPSVVDQMREAAAGGIALRANPATGDVGFVRAPGRSNDLLPGVAAENRAGAVAKAERYLDEFAPAFGARPGELTQAETFADAVGWSVTFEQSYRGIPVFGAELKARVDRQGDLTSVNGFAVPDLGLSTTPTVDEAEAVRRALGLVRSRPSGYEDAVPTLTEGIEAASTDLMIYRTGSPRGIDGTAKLAWVLEVTNEKTVRETVILDALTGKVLNRWSMIAHALDRELYEAYLDEDENPAADLVWSEGDAFPGDLDEDQQNEVLGTAEAYWMFKNTFGYDSYDNEGSTMITVNNDPTINCPNANWNGVTTNYCTGVTGDDTVAHEWGHAYTEYTSGLIYQWQAGAMNEAYSDIWGETVDMLNARDNQLGETQADPIYRTPGTCSDYTRSLTTMEITAPASVAGPCESIPASFGPVITQAGVDGTAIVGIDEANEAGPTTTDGCTDFTNAAEIDGMWVYVDRGTCPFVEKTANAVEAGALGIVVGNTETGAPTSMPGTADIYGVMVSFADGQKFKSAGAPVEFTVAAQPAESDETHRWLSGESDPAFGGAIRDMWNPNCYGDPGKVSDEEYFCGSDDPDQHDAGGVHTNSGVVNRTFAILVDGLDGVVEPIGLDKAANLFWRAQTNYLTPTSYFPDLADALEASCTELTGVDINKVTLGNPTEADGSDGAATPEVVAGGMTAADCSSVTDAIAETELRLDPTEQCDWQPILQQDAPSIDCGGNTTAEAAFEEDFEDGLAGWTQETVINPDWNPEGSGYPWEAVTDAPDHEGGVAFAPDPLEDGSCQGDADDVSSRSSLQSPEITVPDGATPRLSFDHYVATEAGYDGANVKVSVNGGDFELVPAAAYVYNGPAGELATADTNTSPMAGEPAWTGTDGGQLSGSWGTSIIDLAQVAGAGDTIEVRFDFGRDGCNGLDGWYVDNVVVESCVAGPVVEPSATTTSATVRPTSVRRGQTAKVIAKVRADEGTATGRVVVKRAGKIIARGKLEDGRTTITVRTGAFATGKNTLKVVYLGNAKFEQSTDTVSLTVRPRR